MYPNEIDTYNGIKNYCNSKQSTMIVFYNDEDLIDCVNNRKFNSVGFYVSKNINWPIGHVETMLIINF